MTNLPKGNPRIPEGINVSRDHPLKEFFVLVAAIGVVLLVLVFLVHLLARLLAPHIPFDWEKPLAPLVMKYIDGQGAAVETRVEAAVITLGKELLASSKLINVNGEPAAEFVPPGAIVFHLVDSDLPNAFATVGGHIVVTDALLQEVSSENGLAMVVAHEIAHIQLRHPIEAASRGLVTQLLLAAVLGTSGHDGLGGALGSGGTLTLLNFNREMELEADARALAILKQHYGHLGGADEFFSSANQEDSATQWLEFTRTHPNLDKRLQLIHEMMNRDSVRVPLQPLPMAIPGVGQTDNPEHKVPAQAH